MLAASEGVMAVVQAKRMNWFQRIPFWKKNDAWRDYQKAKTDDYLANVTAANSRFATAAINQLQEGAKISAQIAVDRVQAEAKAKLDKAQASALSAQAMDIFA
jgi:hypothetical protein